MKLILLALHTYQSKKFMKYLFAALLIFIGLVFQGCREWPDLGGGYKLYYDGKYTLSIIDKQNNIIVTETIMDFAFDSTFILAAQRPWDETVIPNREYLNYTERNDAFEKSTFLQYWIIDKKQPRIYSYDSVNNLSSYSNVYGPFSKEQYRAMRIKLKVPPQLVLKSEKP